MEIEYALGTKECSFWQGQKAKNVFISDVVIRGMYEYIPGERKMLISIKHFAAKVNLQ